MRLEKDERRDQIREAAQKLFLEKGFRNTSISDIIKETSLSRGGFYHHYGNINEILYDIMREGNEERKRTIKQTMRQKADCDFNQVLADIIMDKMLDANDFVSIYAMFLQEINHDDEIKKLYLKLKEESTEEIIQILGDGHDIENFRRSIDLIIDLINTMILSCEVLRTREQFTRNKDLMINMINTILADNRGGCDD